MLLTDIKLGQQICGNRSRLKITLPTYIIILLYAFNAVSEFRTFSTFFYIGIIHWPLLFFLITVCVNPFDTYQWYFYCYHVIIFFSFVLTVENGSTILLSDGFPINSIEQFLFNTPRMGFLLDFLTTTIL